MTLRGLAVTAPALDAPSMRSASAITETELLHAYNARVEACACGAQLYVADADDGESIAATLRLHYASTRHERWAVRAGWR